MIIELRRHGKYDKGTGELTPESKEEAERISESNKYDKAFSTLPVRCLQTAKILGKQEPIYLITGGEFDDIKQRKHVGEYINKMFQSIIQQGSVKGRILIIGHSNFIAAIECFFNGKEIPQNLDDLPVIPHFGGIQINISKQKI